MRVAVGDDHPVYRRGVRRALEADERIEVVGEAGDGHQALALIQATRPDVALLDLRMPRIDGRAVLVELQRSDAETRVVFLSAFTEVALIHEVLSTGAAGYLSKDADEEELRRAVVSASRDETVVSAELQGDVLDYIRRHGARHGALSAREHQILALVADGMSAVAIGKELHLSPATVKTYQRRIYEKLDVQTQSAAVAEAMRRGLLR